MRQLQYGNSLIHYHLEFRARKTLAIEVHPDTEVVVIAPENTAVAEVEARLLKRASWIRRQQRYFDQFLPRIPQRHYVPGETHYYLGRGYPLKISISDAKSVKLLNGQFAVSAPVDEPKYIRHLLGAWYHDHAQVKYREAFERALRQFRSRDIGTPSFAIRRMKKRWGSCTPGGQILLNPDLIKAPFRSIYYVCVHELCHLVQPTHSKAFYELQTQLMPDWEKWKTKLDGFG